MALKNKYPPVIALASWLDKATPTMKKRLVELAESSECMFRQWSKGRRAMSAEKAGRLAAASVEVHVEMPDSPAPLTRGDLCEACRNCDYFNKVEGDMSDLL